MNNQLILTDLWIDDSLLMAKDLQVGFLVLCSEDAFNLGHTDSLKKHWTTSRLGIKYRKIRGTKRCYSPMSISDLKKITVDLGLIEKIEKSYSKLKDKL